MNNILDIATWQLTEAMHANCPTWESMVRYVLNMLKLADESQSDSLKWAALDIRARLVGYMEADSVGELSYDELQLILWDKLS